MLNSDARLVYSTNRRSIGLVGGLFSFHFSTLFFPLVMIVFLIFMGSGRMSFFIIIFFFISIIIIIAADWLCVGVYTYFCLFLQPFFCFKGDMLIF